jgi:cytochrome c556
MASLFESFSSAIDPKIVSALGKALGAEPSAIQQGLAAAAPLLVGGMNRMASTPSGAASVLGMLPKEADGGLLGGSGSLTSLIGNLFSGGAAGNDMLSSLIGPGLNAVGGSLSKALGFNVTPLLRLAAPAVMGLVSKAVQTNKLDGNGLAELVKREGTQFRADSANAATMKLVDDAMAAGDRAATMIGSYGAEWNKVAAAPVAALMAVSSSDLDGPFDTMKEVKAAQAAVLEATKAAPTGSLLAAACGGGFTESALKSVREMAKDRDALTRLIADATAAVKQHSPGDLDAFRAAIRSIGKATAEASKEGGFLGIGGTLVSDDEKAALAAIERATS